MYGMWYIISAKGSQSSIESILGILTDSQIALVWA